MLYTALWDYQITIKTTIIFYPYQLVHGVELILSVECEIPSLKLAIEFLPDSSELEEHLVHLEHLDKLRWDVVVALEINKCCVEGQYDNSVHPRRYS